MAVKTGFDKWMDRVEQIGIEEGIFDPPEMRFACPASGPRRPYRGEDGLFFQLWQSGVPCQMAIGEALVEQDTEEKV
jgi:hypothetical protein